MKRIIALFFVALFVGEIIGYIKYRRSR